MKNIIKYFSFLFLTLILNTTYGQQQCHWGVVNNSISVVNETCPGKKDGSISIGGLSTVRGPGKLYDCNDGGIPEYLGTGSDIIVNEGELRKIGTASHVNITIKKGGTLVVCGAVVATRVTIDQGSLVCGHGSLTVDQTNLVIGPGSRVANLFGSLAFMQGVDVNGGLLFNVIGSVEIHNGLTVQNGGLVRNGKGQSFKVITPIIGDDEEPYKNDNYDYENDFQNSITCATITWKDPSGNLIADQGNKITGLSAGTYTARITCGSCTRDFPIEVGVKNNGPVISFENPNPTVCTGGKIQLVAKGASSYKWFPETGLNAYNIPNPEALNVTEERKYTVTGTTSEGCTGKGEITIKPDQSGPTITFENSNPTVCKGGDIQLRAMGATSYNWQPQTGLTAYNIPDPTALGVSTERSYTVTGTDNKGCIGKANITIRPTGGDAKINISPSNPIVCPGESVQLNASGAVSYKWTPSIGLNRTDIANPVATVQTTTTYTIEGMTAQGCKATGTVTITTNSLLQATADITPSSTATSCDGRITPTITGRPGPYSFSWTGPGNFSSTSQTITGLCPGEYILKASTKSGCSIEEVFVLDLCGAGYKIERIDPSCPGRNDGMVKISGLSAGCIVSWSYQGKTIKANTLNNIGPGTYTATINCGSCTRTETIELINEVASCPCEISPCSPIIVRFTSDKKVSIRCGGCVGKCGVIDKNGSMKAEGTLFPQPQYSDSVFMVQYGSGCRIPVLIPPGFDWQCEGEIAIHSTSPTCHGSKDGRLEASYPGATSYSWTGFGIINGENRIQENVGKGDYWVTAYKTDPTGEHSCNVKAGIRLEDPMPLKASYELANSAVRIKVSGGTPGYKVRWLHDGIISNIRTDLKTGENYTVEISDKKGCSLNYSFKYDPCQQNEPVEVYALVSGTTATAIASGGSGAYKYLWRTSGMPVMPDPTRMVQTNLVSGAEYELIATDHLGCQDKAIIKLGCGLSVSTESESSCEDECEGKASVTVNTRVQTTVRWDDNKATGPVLYNACPGVHKAVIIVTDPKLKGCAIRVSVKVATDSRKCNNATPPDLTIRVISQRDKACHEDESFVDVRVSGGIAPFTYTWTKTTGGQSETYVSNNEDLENASPGTYRLVVKDSRGTEKTLTITVGGPSTSLHLQANVTQIICEGGKGSAQLVVSGGVSPYRVRWPDGSASFTRFDLNPGNYEVKVTDRAGCERSVMAVIEEAIFDGEIYTNRYRICEREGETVTLVAKEIAGYSYTWSGAGVSTGYSGRELKVKQAGTYTLHYTQPGCSNQSRQVTVIASCPDKPEEWCAPVTIKDVPFNETENCIAQKIIAAEAVAHQKYRNYIEEERRKFKSEYIDKILSTAKEKLEMEYADREHHYTLYYYDQSGNLVRTVPPGGVKALSNAQAEEATADMMNKEEKVYTEHILGTTYKYNSLNQVVAIDNPDQEKLDLWEVSHPTGMNLSSDQKATDVIYTGDHKAVVIANGSDYSEIFVTSNGGSTWTKETSLGTGDIRDVQKVDNSIAYAAGKSGTFLKSTNGGGSWVIKAVPTDQDLIHVHFRTATNGIIMASDGTIWRTTDGGDTWIDKLETLKSRNPGTIHDVSSNGSDIWVASESSGRGRIFYGTNNGSNWEEHTDFKVFLNSSIDLGSGNYLSAGPVGSVFKLDGTGKYKMTRSNLTTGIKQLSNEQGILAVGSDNKIYSGNEAGTTWDPVSGTPTTVRELFDVNSKVIAVTTDNKIAVKPTSGNWSFSAITNLGAITSISKIRHLTPSQVFNQTDGSGFYILSGTVNLLAYRKAGAALPITNNWTKVTINTPPAGFSVKDAIVSGNNIWLILGSNGNGTLYRTTAGNNTLTIGASISSGIDQIFTKGNDVFVLTTHNAIKRVNIASSTNITLADVPNFSSLPMEYTIPMGFRVGITDFDFRTSGTGANVRITEALVHYSNGATWEYRSGGWVKRTESVQPSVLKAIEVRGDIVLDPQYPAITGYAAGNNGEIYGRRGTSDVWEYMPHITANLTITDIDFSTENKVRVVANKRVYTYSTNALTQESNINHDIEELDTEGSSAVLGTASGRIYEKTGTANWTTTFAQSSVSMSTVDIHSNGSHIAGGTNTKIYFKSGSTSGWFLSPSLRTQPLKTVVKGSEDFIVAIGNKGTIVTSTNGGEDWDVKYTGLTEDLLSVEVYGNSKIWIGAEPGIIRYSTDGGNTWSSSVLPATATTRAIRAIKTADGNTLFAIANHLLLKSTDGGATFAVEKDLFARGSAIWLDNDGYGYIISLNNGPMYRISPSGTGYTYTRVNRDTNLSDDKGSGIPSNISFYKLIFTDRLTGYITGEGGWILKTTDGGYHWRVQGQGGTGTPVVALKDKETGIQVNADGTVSKLRDRSGQYSSRIWYDEAGRQVLSQNSKQYNIEKYLTSEEIESIPSAPDKARAYSYVLYDTTGRVTETGEVIHRLILQGGDNALSYSTLKNLYVKGASSVRREITRTYYDVVKFDNILAGFSQMNLRTRIASITYHDKEDQESTKYDRATHYSYDVHGNVKTVVQEIRVSGEELKKRIDYEYDLVSGKVTKVYYQKGEPDQFIHRYEYDGDNRITKVYTSRDGIIWDNDANYQYYAHGPLARTEIGQHKVETQDYAYTLQGWVKGLNGNNFSYAIGYNNNDYKSIGSNNLLSTPVTNQLFNGNIATITSNTPKINEVNPSQPATITQQYEYDQLNRIVKSSMLNGSHINSYKTSYSYDPNGNIETLQRYNESGVLFDDLTYTYERGPSYRNSNRLRQVIDRVYASTIGDIRRQPTDNYDYDEIGNLNLDKQEEIERIDWTVSGKIKYIKRTAESSKPDLEFAYDALGNRVSKTVIEKNGNKTTTFYVRDAQGNVLATYESAGGNTNVQEWNIYGSTRIGTYATTNSSMIGLNSHTSGLRNYELTDHLSNVRIVISDQPKGRSNVGLTIADVVAANDYYPFGMVMPERHFTSGLGYKYGFGGHEKDDELKGIGNHLSFGDYGYDPRIGRRWNIDPMAIKMPEMSPYSFAYNNPVILIDPDGNLPILPFLLKAGAAGATDLLMQVGMNYLLDDDVETIGQAFQKVDWIDVSISAAQGALPWSVPGGKYAKAAATATSDVLINAGKAALNGEEYSLNDGMRDYFIGFLSELSSEQAEKLLSSKKAQEKIQLLLGPSTTSNDKLDIIPSTKDGFIVTSDGTVMHKNVDELKTSLETAGFKGSPTTLTTEPGMIYELPTDKHSSGKYTVRVMDGQPGGDQFKGPRVVTTRTGKKDYVKPDGSEFPNGTPKSERKAGGHTHVLTK